MQGERERTLGTCQETTLFLPPSLPPSLTHSLTHALTHSSLCSPTHPLTHSFPNPSIPHSLTHSLPPSLPPSLSHRHSTDNLIDAIAEDSESTGGEEGTDSPKLLVSPRKSRPALKSYKSSPVSLANSPDQVPQYMPVWCTWTWTAAHIQPPSTATCMYMYSE